MLVCRRPRAPTLRLPWSNEGDCPCDSLTPAPSWQPSSSSQRAPRVPAQDRPPTVTPFDVVVYRNVMVTSRDGVRLATDIYLPARNGVVSTRVPAIVERTPYNKERGAEALSSFFVPRGYAVVFQDVRGRYRSEGRWRPITDDGPDGADLLKWIAEQPWSSGKVGMVGTSYAGGHAARGRHHGRPGSRGAGARRCDEQSRLRRQFATTARSNSGGSTGS